MSSTARGKREPGVGDHVIVGGKKGVIQFSGETQFASGKWVGVHLEKPEGKNDGSVQGVTYFTCPPNHGLFVKSSMAKLDPDWKEPATVRTTASPSPTPSDTSTSTSSSSPALTGIRAPSPQIVPAASPSAASIPASLLVTPAKPPTAADPTPAPQTSVATPSLVEKQSVLKQAEEKRAALKEKQPDTGARRPSVLEDDAARAASPAPTSIRAASPAPTSASTSSAPSTAASAATAAELAKAHAEAMANAKAHADALAQAAVYRDEIVALKKQLNDATTQVTTLKQESAKLKAELTKANTESDEVAELKLMIETLTLDKDLAEETVEESKTEIATLNARMEALTKELEDVRAQRQQAHTQFLETLPADKADQAKLVDQNQQLAIALKQLHDVSVTEKNKSTSIIARLEKELEVLRANQTELENLRKLTKQQSTQITELKEALDEASEHEAMVEVLSEKNLQLGEQIKEMEKSMTYQQSLITASEEVEEGHVEFEQQLQRELDAKESELHELYGKLKYKQQQMDEMNKSVRQFRELTKHLENELEEARRQQSTHTNRNTSTSQETRGTSSLQLSRGLLEMKKKTVASHLAKLEAEQAKRKAELVQAYLPENISVDEHSHSLLLLIDRLRSKYSILQQLLHESYGYGTHMSITSDDPQEQQVIMMVYHVCTMMMDHVRGMEYITYGLQRTDVETYNLAASRHKDLLTLEPLLDTWFTQISNDTVHATTSLQPLYDAYPTILKYMMVIFNGTLSLPPTYDVGHVTPITEKMRSEYTLSDKRLPTPLTIVTDAQQLQYHSYGIRIPMQHMGDILTSMQSAIKQGRAALQQKENKNDADTAIATAAGVDVDDLSSSQILFNKLEDIQITIQSLCQQLLTNAKSYEVIASSHRKTSVVDPVSLIEPFTTVHAHMTSTIHRLVTLHTSIRAILSREQIMEWSRGRGLEDVDSVTSRIDTVLSPEVKENTGVLHDLQRLKTEISDLSKKLVGHDADASTALSASTTAAAHLTTVSAPYEAHATAIRQQLQQAASMRVALQEAQQRMAEKTRELFTVKTQNQENAAKIEALQSKLKLLQGRAESTTDLRTELEAYKKRDAEVKQAMEVLNADLDKYSNDNKALRKQLVKVKYTLKQMEQQKQNEAATAPTTGGSKSLLTSAKDLSNMQTASEQIELLQRTIRMLRQALAQERATRQIHILTHELPPLPNVRTALAPASHQRVQDPVEPPKAIPSIPHPFTTSTPASSTSTLAAITGMIAGTNATTGVAGTSQPQPRTHRLGSLIAADLASSVPVHHVPIPDDRTIMQQLAQQLTTLKKQVTLYRAAPALVDLTSLQQQQLQREEVKSKEAADREEKKQTTSSTSTTTMTPSQYHSDRSRAYAYQLAATKLQLEIEQISRKIRVSRLHAASSTTQALPTVPATPAPVTEKLIGKLTAPAPITLPTSTSDKKTPTPPLPSKLLLQRQQLLELHAMLLK